MRSPVPRIHSIENLIGLMNGINGTFRKNVQIRIRHNQSHLDNPVGLRIKSCHFKIDPDQIQFIRFRFPAAILRWFWLRFLSL